MEDKVMENKHTFAGFDEQGNIKCGHCGNFTNKHYITIPGLTCWSCNEIILSSHTQTIRDIVNGFFPSNEPVGPIDIRGEEKKWEQILHDKLENDAKMAFRLEERDFNKQNRV